MEKGLIELRDELMSYHEPERMKELEILLGLLMGASVRAFYRSGFQHGWR